MSYRLIATFVGTAPVVVAARDIDAYRMVNASDLRLTDLPVRAVPKGSFSSPKEVVGTYSLSRLCEGQVVLKPHVSRETKEVGFSLALSSETRGFFVPASASRGIGGMLKRGEQVDVICVQRGAFAGEPLVIPNVQVVEVVKDSSSAEFLGALVVLSPWECELLASSMETGSLYLALVPKVDWGAIIR